MPTMPIDLDESKVAVLKAELARLKAISMPSPAQWNRMKEIAILLSIPRIYWASNSQSSVNPDPNGQKKGL